MSTQKVAVVTGSNKGIGYAIVKGLCEKFNGVVFLTARDVGRGEAAVEKLKILGFNPKFHQLDITDQASIDKLKDYLSKTYQGLDLLINNAGVFIKDNAPLGEQAEKHLAVNYYGTLKVCETLFPILRNNAKVVNVSSAFGHLSKIPSAELRAKLKDQNLTIPELSKLMEQSVKDTKERKNVQNGWGNSSYVVSKVGVSALTIIQQRQFNNERPNRNIAVNSVHPGYIDTDLTDHQGPWTIEQGARAPLWLALEADVKGKYVWSDTRIVQWDSAAPPALY